jgi:probable rRNA maturation factor
VPSIDVQIDDPFLQDVDPQDIARAVALALEAEGHGEAEVTVVLTDDETITGLSRQYRHEEGPTDVLSFSAVEPAAGFVTAPGAALYLGDIVIAVPYTRQQAATLGRTLRDELRLLAVHGALHLLGYDHATAEDETRMWARQDAFLTELAREA